MAATLTLKILSPEGSLFEAEVKSVKVPGEDGLFGILPRHAAMAALTDSGILEAELPSGEKVEFLIHDGFADVRNNVVKVLTSAAERPDTIDFERARKAADEARKQLQERDASLEHSETIAALRRALARERGARRQRG